MVRIRNTSNQKLSCPDLCDCSVLVIKPGEIVDMDAKRYQTLSRLYSSRVFERLDDAQPEPIPDNVRLGPGTPIKKRTKKK